MLLVVVTPDADMSSEARSAFEMAASNLVSLGSGVDESVHLAQGGSWVGAASATDTGSTANTETNDRLLLDAIAYMAATFRMISVNETASGLTRPSLAVLLLSPLASTRAPPHPSISRIQALLTSIPDAAHFRAISLHILYASLDPNAASQHVNLLNASATSLTAQKTRINVSSCLMPVQLANLAAPAIQFARSHLNLTRVLVTSKKDTNKYEFWCHGFKGIEHGACLGKDADLSLQVVGGAPSATQGLSDLSHSCEHAAILLSPSVDVLQCLFDSHNTTELYLTIEVATQSKDAPPLPATYKLVMTSSSIAMVCINRLVNRDLLVPKFLRPVQATFMQTEDQRDAIVKPEPRLKLETSDIFASSILEGGSTPDVRNLLASFIAVYRPKSAQTLSPDLVNKMAESFRMLAFFIKDSYGSNLFPSHPTTRERESLCASLAREILETTYARRNQSDLHAQAHGHATLRLTNFASRAAATRTCKRLVDGEEAVQVRTLARARTAGPKNDHRVVPSYLVVNPVLVAGVDSKREREFVGAEEAAMREGRDTVWKRFGAQVDAVAIARRNAEMEGVRLNGLNVEGVNLGKEVHRQLLPMAFD
ncbi:hypothetical protein BC830DRAFT_1165830 [Chytriomyces sp. MP71]|nr:hypothetical protein BC830DRAFT_1165830 [Chytriomyces sp. MP71]